MSTDAVLRLLSSGVIFLFVSAIAQILVGWNTLRMGRGGVGHLLMGAVCATAAFYLRDVVHGEQATQRYGAAVVVVQFADTVPMPLVLSPSVTRPATLQRALRRADGTLVADSGATVRVELAWTGDAVTARLVSLGGVAVRDTLGIPQAPETVVPAVVGDVRRITSARSSEAVASGTLLGAAVGAALSKSLVSGLVVGGVVGHLVMDGPVTREEARVMWPARAVLAIPISPRASVLSRERPAVATTGPVSTGSPAPGAPH